MLLGATVLAAAVGAVGLVADIGLLSVVGLVGVAVVASIAVKLVFEAIAQLAQLDRRLIALAAFERERYLDLADRVDGLDDRTAAPPGPGG